MLELDNKSRHLRLLLPQSATLTAPSKREPSLASLFEGGVAEKATEGVKAEKVYNNV